jgi:CubicO group peptidase (beta-lactamase class C family)
MSAEKTFERHVRLAQKRGRIPAVTAAVHRCDRPLWTFTVGGSATTDTRFRIGSITKTFTAVLVLQCRDDGLLELDDPLAKHVDVAAHGDLTIARMLAHNAGLQREPFGDVWDTMRAPDDAELLATLDRAERVLPSGRRMHYSNLAFALLGRVVADKRGGTWAQALAERVLTPLGLAATTVEPTSRATTGHLVDAYSDHARREPVLDCRALGPAAQLWSTAADMARWAAFLADPAALDPGGAVLAPATLAEMRWPRTVSDESRWSAAFGLGLLIVPQGSERIVHIGHDGAMPGFLASAYGRQGGDGVPAGLGAAVLGSSGTGVEVLELPHTLLGAAVDEDPAEITAWEPGEPAPSALRSVLGRWWGEGFEYVFFWRDGRLRARAAEDPGGRPPAVFVPVDGSPDVMRTESGREAGELLRLTRDGSGAVVRMHWATYRFTRGQESFDGTVASEP